MEAPKHNLSVVPIREKQVSLCDIAACLRRMAERIEAGEIKVETLLYVHVYNGRCRVGEFGESLDRMQILGALEAGKAEIIANYHEAVLDGYIGDPEDAA